MESKVIRGEESRPTFGRTPMTRMSSDVIGQTASATLSHAVDASGREGDGKSSSPHPDFGRAVVWRRVTIGGKPNISRPSVSRSVSHECDSDRFA